MFKLRSIEKSDLDHLFELSQKMTFINLPADKKILENKIASSIQSFDNPHEDLTQNHYIFGLEDLVEKKIIGVSMIHAQHGSPNEPHVYFKVSQKQYHSQSLNKSMDHHILEFKYAKGNLTEIGGLILDPKYRGNPYKLGKQLSFVRFLYMGLNPQRFHSNIHVELLPPMDKNSEPPLWKALGKKFTGMNYFEADLLSLKNKEFIISLFPDTPIHLSLLPQEAQNAIGKVGKETQGVKKMLKDVGFQFNHEVDPFDGGPHYRAQLPDILPIKNLQQGKVKGLDKLDDTKKKLVLITPHKNSHKENKFWAIGGYVEERTNEIYMEQQFIDDMNLNMKDIYNYIYL